MGTEGHVEKMEVYVVMLQETKVQKIESRMILDLWGGILLISFIS